MKTAIFKEEYCREENYAKEELQKVYLGSPLVCLSIKLYMRRVQLHELGKEQIL